MSWLRHHYGAGPIHLISLVACLAFSGYLVTQVFTAPEAGRILLWFAGAASAHDLVLWPLYAVADRGAVAAGRRHPERLPKVPWINHLRVPAVLSAVALAVSFPLVFGQSERAYHAASGLTEDPYLGRWLLFVAMTFGVSALLYAWRVGRRWRLDDTPHPSRLRRHGPPVADRPKVAADGAGDLGTPPAPGVPGPC